MLTLPPNVGFVDFLPIDRDGRLHATFELAYYENDTTRFVYVGTLLAPNELRLERREHYCPHDSLSGDGPWSGVKHFAQKGPGADVLRMLRKCATDFIQNERVQGTLLATALDIAAVNRATIDAWATNRIRHLFTLDAETVRRQHGSLLSAIGCVTQTADVVAERWSRILTLNGCLRDLGREFCVRGEDTCGAQIFGRTTSKVG